jgi:molecular chaperone HtpG
LAEYVAKMPEEQQKIYYLSGQSIARMAAAPQVKALENKGYDVLFMTEEVDEFVPQMLMSYSEKTFCNCATEDLGLQTEDEKKALEEKAQQKKGMLDFVKEALGEKVTEVRLSADLGEQAVNLVSANGMSFEMEKYMKRMQPDYALPSMWILELNPEHTAVQAMELATVEDPDKAKDYAKLLCAQAQLMAELPLENPAEFAELVCKLMK